MQMIQTLNMVHTRKTDRHALNLTMVLYPQEI